MVVTRICWWNTISHFYAELVLCYLWLLLSTSHWCPFWRIRGSILPLSWLRVVLGFRGQWYISDVVHRLTAGLLRRGWGSIGTRWVVSSRARLELGVPVCQKVIVFFLLVISAKGVVWVVLNLLILGCGGVLGEETGEGSAEFLLQTTADSREEKNTTLPGRGLQLVGYLGGR